MMECQPFQSTQCIMYTLPHQENQCQWSVNNFWSCQLGIQGIAQIYELITELLTAIIGKNTTYKRKNMDSKIMDMANCNTPKKRLLPADYPILVRYYYQTAKARALYESTNGPAGRHWDNSPNSDRLGNLHPTAPKLTVLGCWHPGWPIRQRFRFNPDPYPMWWSATIANTTHR